MSRETIAIDVDDVLAAHIEAFVAHSNVMYGTNLTPEQYSEVWSEIWGVDHNTVEQRALEFHHPEIVGNFGVIKDAQEALEQLKVKRDLVIVTGRSKHIIDTTKDWLGKNFPGLFSDVHFVPIWEPDNKITKADICVDIGADYLVDDLIRHCNLAAQVGIKAVLFASHAWNQDEELHPDVTRVDNWQEVVEYFDEQG
jgi:5'(3')-deoxyribonucleotidase